MNLIGSSPADGIAASGIHSLDRIVMTIPDLEEGRRFFESFGLDVRVANGGIDLYCFGNSHCWVSLKKGPTKRLKELIFGTYLQHLPINFEWLAQMQVEDLAREEDGSICFRDPEGTIIRIVVAAKSAPDAKSAPSSLHKTVLQNQAACPLRSKAPRVFPRRFSHALVFTADTPSAVEFYCSALGLGLSDEAGGEVAFLHGKHGSDHHLIAFAKGGGPGLHHTAWDVGSVQEIGLGMTQMELAGFGKNGWGLGRHVLGSNYFLYVRDPWNSYAEYSFDIDYIKAGFCWTPGHHLAEDGFYLWGPNPPADFSVNYELMLGAVNRASTLCL